MKMGILQRQAIDKAQQQCQTHMHRVRYEERREKVRRIRDRPATMEASKTMESVEEILNEVFHCHCILPTVL
jgi:hypothetical protein